MLSLLFFCGCKKQPEQQETLTLSADKVNISVTSSPYNSYSYYCEAKVSFVYEFGFSIDNEKFSPLLVGMSSSEEKNVRGHLLRPQLTRKLRLILLRR